MKVLFALVFLFTSFISLAQPKIIAHRGFWDTDGSAQNSIASLQKAAEINAYGSEFDVFITADGIAVLNHDDKINGKKIEDVNYSEIQNETLKNGELIPTLSSFFQAAKKLDIKLFLEIKPHTKTENENRAVAEVLRLVKKYKLKKRVEYISFSLNICKQIVVQNKKAKVHYLNGELSPVEIKALGFAGIDYNQKVYEKNPTWISEAKKLKLATNVWTVNAQDKMEYFIKENIDYITTDKPVFLQKLQALNK